MMTYEGDYKPGNIAIYCDDNSLIRVKVLESKGNADEEFYTLEVIKTIIPHSICGPMKPGRRFNFGRPRGGYVKGLGYIAGPGFASLEPDTRDWESLESKFE